MNRSYYSKKQSNGKRQLNTRQQFNTKAQSGFSLVELMIAGTLGILLIGGVLQLFVGSNQNYRMQDDLAVMQEEGRLALMFLKEQIQSAGWTADDRADPINPIRLPNFPAPAATGQAAAIETTDGATDSIAISYAVGTLAGGGAITDCNGNAVPGGSAIVNRFYVDNQQLMCLGNGSATPQPLIGGVDDFQVLYGIENTNTPGCFSGRITGYMTATQLSAVNPEFTTVLSVKVALMLASEDEVLPEATAKTIRVFDQTRAVNDRTSRRVFQQNIFIPNAALAFAGSGRVLSACGL